MNSWAHTHTHTHSWALECVFTRVHSRTRARAFVCPRALCDNNTTAQWHDSLMLNISPYFEQTAPNETHRRRKAHHVDAQQTETSSRQSESFSPCVCVCVCLPWQFVHEQKRLKWFSSYVSNHSMTDMCDRFVSAWSSAVNFKSGVLLLLLSNLTVLTFWRDRG